MNYSEGIIMNRECEVLCEKISDCIVNRDFEAVHAVLAPWLRGDMKPSRIQEMVDAAMEGLTHPPLSWKIDEGMASLEDLRKPDSLGPPSQEISKKITSDNFRGWLCITFAPNPSVFDEQNICFDLWIIAVACEGAVLVGYLEASEPT